MKDRLLNAYLTGTVDEAAYKAKSHELSMEEMRTDDTLAQLGDIEGTCMHTAMALFDWSQQADAIWRRSNNAVRRQILDAVYLNRALGRVNLVTTKRKPFDILAERPDSKKSRGDRTAIELFLSGLKAWPRSLQATSQGLTSDSTTVDPGD
jgi:hypothetical protein